MRVGYTKWARQTVDSEIFSKKPDKWFKIWFYIVNRANFIETSQYSRGECFLTTTEIAEVTNASSDQIKKFLRWARDSDMLTTKRSTRGMHIKVLKYNIYQGDDVYKSTRESAAPSFVSSSFKVGTRELLEKANVSAIKSEFNNNRSTRKALEKHQRSTPIGEEGKKERTNIKAIALKERLLINKTENMGFRNIESEDPDDLPVKDAITGELNEKNKQSTRKYPNAPTIRKIFQEILGVNPASWRQHKPQLLACENLYEERGVTAVRNALTYYNEHHDDEFIPKITSPYDLDSKWTKLGSYKKKQESV